jgi:hypothetical protein
MKFMVLVKANKDSEAGVLPREQDLSEMMKYNEELAKAGVLLDLAGLQASSKGAKVRFHGKERTVIDGPFTEAKELIAGYWILQCKSLAECIEWVKRAPCPGEGTMSEIEIRPYFELTDFPEANAETLERAAKIDQAIKA